jgi:WD40 repeat protein
MARPPQLWDLDTLQVAQRIQVAGTDTNAIAFSPDGMRLAVGVGEELRVGPTANLRALARRASFPAKVGAVVYSPDGATLAVGLGDGTIVALPARGRGRPHTIGGHPIFGYATSVSGLRFTNEGRWLVSAGWDAAMRVWDPKAGLEVAACHTDSQVFGLTVDGTGRWAMTGPKRGEPRLWDLGRVRDVRAVDRHGGGVGVGHVLGLDGGDVVVTGGAEQDGATIRMWRTSDGAPQRTILVKGRLLSLAQAVDNRTLHVLDEAGVTSCSLARSVAGADVQLGPASPLDPAPELYWTTCMAPDVVVAVQIGYPDNKVVIWRTPDWIGKPVCTLKPVDDVVAISTNGRICAVRTHGLVIQGSISADAAHSGSSSTLICRRRTSPRSPFRRRERWSLSVPSTAP